MSLLKAVFFDLDGTLYSYDDADAVGTAALRRHVCERLDIDEDLFSHTFDQARRDVKAQLPPTASCHNRMLYMQRLCELLDVNPVDYAPEMYDAYWDHFLDSMVLFDGAGECLEKCRSRGLKTVLVTNMTAQIQYRKLRKLGLGSLFDALVISEEAGMEKPDPAIFAYALHKTGLRAGNCVHIGDSFNGDVLGARGAGIPSIWFSSDTQSHPGYERISRLADLLPLLEKMNLL